MTATTARASAVREPSEPVPDARGRVAPAALAVLVVGAVVGWLRVPSAARGVLWAEDSTVFLHGQVTLGAGTALGTSYDGYLHGLPRLLAPLALLAGPAHAALLVTALSVVAVAVVGAILVVLSGLVVRSTTARVAIGLVPVLAPTAPVETLGTLANLHWYLLLLAPFVFATVPRRWWTAVALSAAGFVIALTEPLSLVAVPLLLRGWRVPRRWLVTVAVGAGLLLQLVADLAHPRHRPEGVPVGRRSLVAGYVLQPLTAVWTQHTQAVTELVHGHGWVVVVVPAAVVLGLLVAGTVAADLRARVAIVGAAVLSVALWVLSLSVSPVPGLDFTDLDADVARPFPVVRYTTACSMLLLVALVVSAEALIRRGGRARLVGTAAAVALAGCALVALPVSHVSRAGGPELAPQVTAVEEGCARAPGSTVVRLLAAPSPAWSLVATCDQLREAR